MNFSVLDYSICPQNASNCTDCSLDFQNFPRGMPSDPQEISSFLFFICNSSLCLRISYSRGRLPNAGPPRRSPRRTGTPVTIASEWLKTSHVPSIHADPCAGHGFRCPQDPLLPYFTDSCGVRGQLLLSLPQHPPPLPPPPSSPPLSIPSGSDSQQTHNSRTFF